MDYPSVIRNAGLNHLTGTAPSPSPIPPQEYITYVIQSGDTLSGIAARFGTTVSALAALNNISDPDKIYAGATLRVPETGSGTKTYTIRPGDTLSGIAVKFGTTVNTLAALNGITDPDRIYAGTTIKIP